MYAVISPAKRLHQPALDLGRAVTVGPFIAESAELGAILKTLSRSDLQSLMGLSESLSNLNLRRFQQLGGAPTVSAVALFDGDTYRGFDSATLSAEDLLFSQRTVGILSGLYGLLRPLDGIEPHRLEMATKLVNARGKTLYAFWADRVGLRVKEQLSGDEPVVNLASQAYFKVIRAKALGIPVLEIVFQERRDGQDKVIGLMAKRARGAMARYIVIERLDRVEGLRDFTAGGYCFITADSTENRWVFRR